MFETTLMLKLTPYAVNAPHRDVEYQKCWQALPKVFDPHQRDMSKVEFKATP